MITFFTTAKDFVGEIRIAQINAIKSWQLAHEQVEIILFGDSKGAREIAEEFKLVYIPDVKTSSQGTPFVNDMFEKASAIASNEICCFINADIIIYKKFFQSIINIHRELKSDYLIVGQRLNIDLDAEIDFREDWEDKLNNLVLKSATIPPFFSSGSDFFAFPKFQYQKGSMPDLMVGRAGWDLWMIYNARLREFKVIDLSDTVMVLHQNHNYSHRKVKFENYDRDGESLSNYGHFPENEKYLYTLPACNYSFKNRELKRNFARGNLKMFLIYEIRLKRSNLIVGPLVHVLDTVPRIKQKIKQSIAAEKNLN